jgi:hypothetical protein
VFELQDEIARCFVASIEPELARAELRRARRKPPENLDAWDLTLHALEDMSQTPWPATSGPRSGSSRR